jgi:hypothetical protein
MKKLFMFMFVLSCMCASAQTSKDKSDSDKMTHKKSAMTGCMMEKDGHMMMMNKMHPDGVMMMGSEKMDMKAHVGHMMKVTGTMGMMGPDGKMMTMSDKDKMKSGEMMMQVDSMKMMKDSCDAGSMKH